MKLLSPALKPAAAAILALLAACSAPADDAALIRALLDRGAALAEEKDLDGVMALLAEDYADDAGRDKAAMRALVRDHLEPRVGVVVRVLEAEVGEVRDGTAPVRADIALSAGAAKVLRKIFSSFGSLYRFRFDVRKAGPDWRIASASWEEIGAGDLSETAAAVLRELFGPDE